MKERLITVAGCLAFILAVAVPLRRIVESYEPQRLTWGSDTALDVPADYDGDGRVDLAVFEPSTGNWHVAFAAGGPNLTKAALGLPGFGIVQQWGLSGDRPVANDFDRDGRADYAVQRVVGNGFEWHIRLQSGAVHIFLMPERDRLPVLGAAR